ncbi:MAG: M20/M25/M40 family metallo-hydrolase [Candidatus Helarchaeota archaeon]
MAEKDYIVDSDENSDLMYDVIAEVLEKAGPRAPCSMEEKKAAELLAEKLKKYCDSVEIEEFQTYPQLGLISWTKRAAGLILLSLCVFIIQFFINLPFIPILITSIAIGINVLNLIQVVYQYLFCIQWSPKVFPYKSKTSQNVVGVIKPSGEVKNRVIYGGHIDSAFRFNHLQYFHEGYAFFLIGSIITLFTFVIIYVFQLIYSIIGFDIVWITYWILNRIALWLMPTIGIVFIGLIVISAKLLNAKQREKIVYGAFSKVTPVTLILLISFVAYYFTIDIIFYNWLTIDPNLFKTSIVLLLNSLPYFYGLINWLSNKAVPGALDNLSAVAVCVAVAKIVKDWKNTDKFPKNTEVVIALFGCEEIGSKGAEAFAKKHASEYNKINTTCVNFDTLHDAKTVKIFKREESTRTDFDPEVYNLLARSAKELGINYKVDVQPGISGGTDSSGLKRGGLRTAPIVGIDYQDYFYYYHTDRDNLNLINKKRRPCNDFGTDWFNRNVRCAMENSLRISILYLKKVDAGEQD